MKPLSETQQQKTLNPTYISYPQIRYNQDIFNRMAQAVTETRGLIPAYISDHPEFRDIGERMMTAWNEGLKGLIK